MTRPTVRFSTHWYSWIPYEQADLADNYCQAFDLATNIPPGVIKSATDAGQLIHVSVSNQGHFMPLEGVLSSVAQVLGSPTKFVRISALPTSHSLQCSGVNEARKPLRICINNLGGVNWGDCTPQVSTLMSVNMVVC